MSSATCTARPALVEVTARFACFGTTAGIVATGEDEATTRAAVARGRAVALDLHERLTRFDEASELCRLNADPRTTVPTGRLLRRLASAARWAAEVSDGLVDATCLPAVEAAGYRGHFDPAAPPVVATADPAAPVAAPGSWRDLRVRGDRIVRPPGLLLDSGGLGKGLAADLIGHELRDCESWVVDCAGDLRLGGTGEPPRAIHVADPLGHPGGPPLHTLRLRSAAVATSGVTRRAWAGGHHLIDPRTDAPARTGVLQVTALAPTGLLAEVRAKAALLSGMGGAEAWLPDGGVVVGEHGVLHVHAVAGGGAVR
jgi:thiamine biosynthesis lipoprotein